jgi:hypothetical protein
MNLTCWYGTLHDDGILYLPAIMIVLLCFILLSHMFLRETWGNNKFSTSIFSLSYLCKTRHSVDQPQRA